MFVKKPECRQQSLAGLGWDESVIARFSSRRLVQAARRVPDLSSARRIKCEVNIFVVYSDLFLIRFINKIGT